MKKILLSLCFIFLLCEVTSAQVTKFRAFSMYMAFKNADGSIEKNSANLETDILIVMNIQKQKIIIYTEPKEEFDIIKATDSYIDNYSLLKLSTIGNNGEEAKITIMKSNNTNSTTVLLDFEKYGVVYSVKSL